MNSLTSVNDKQSNLAKKNTFYLPHARKLTTFNRLHTFLERIISAARYGENCSGFPGERLFFEGLQKYGFFCSLQIEQCTSSGSEYITERSGKTKLLWSAYLPSIPTQSLHHLAISNLVVMKMKFAKNLLCPAAADQFYGAKCGCFDSVIVPSEKASESLYSDGNERN